MTAEQRNVKQSDMGRDTFTDDRRRMRVKCAMNAHARWAIRGTIKVKPPQAFYDFTLQFHQDLHLVYPGWASESPTARHEIYADFRERYGEQAVRALRDFSRRLLSDEHLDIETLWFEESKADWVISEDGIRRLFKDFEAWASSLG